MISFETDHGIISSCIFLFFIFLIFYLFFYFQFPSLLVLVVFLSFGIILWEIHTRSDPFGEFPQLKFLIQLVDAITDGCRPTVPPSCPPAWASLVQDCWQVASDQRPTFRKIVDRLMAIEHDLESPQIIPALDPQYHLSHVCSSMNSMS